MSLNRRQFLKVSSAVGAAALLSSEKLAIAEETRALYERLDKAAAKPVLEVSGLDSPVIVKSMELLRNGKNFVIRVRTKDGAEGISVPNAMHFVHTYPIFVNRVAPFFVGKDARDLEELLWESYRWNDNYKYQGLPLWVCTAGAEFAILDLLGKLAKKPIGGLLGGVKRTAIPVYRASGTRGNTPEAEIEDLRKLVEQTGAKALKFRLGGRMSRNADSLDKRTERLIPLARKEFGPQMTLYADANSSYDAAHAIPVGRLMEENQYGFYEEPCRFDDWEGTKEVADALTIPVAGGEQEGSEYRFRWAIANRAVDVVQPDLHYYGGFIRSMRVARMAHEAGLTCTPHMSGSGLGFLDVLHFVSCLPNPSDFHEFKGDTDIPIRCATSSLKCVNGVMSVPTGHGFGIEVEPSYLNASTVVKSA